MKIYFATDHAGYDLKESLVTYVKSLGHEVIDMGAREFIEDDDYPDYVIPAVREIVGNKDARAIILGGSGQGEAIAANRIKGVRAVVFNGQYNPGDGRLVPREIMLSRQHNDSNVLSLGARFLSEDDARKAVKEWLETPFSEDERHARRLAKIEEMTKEHD